MVITRKIEIFVCEDDKDLRKEYYQKLYDNRNIAVKVANMGVSHEFILDNTLPYLSEEARKQVKFLGVKGNAATRQNAPYVVASEHFKGQADMGMISCVLQNVHKMYQDDRKKGMWDRSLRSYKSTMPVPYGAKSFLNLRFAEYEGQDGTTHEGCFFTLMKIPFQLRFGRDRSGNRVIVKRILDQQRFDATDGKEGQATGYKMCTSSIAFEKKFDPKSEKKKSKIFLYLCVDIPKKEVELDAKKVLYAYLGINHPIQCLLNAKCDDIHSRQRWIEIGTAEEFLYRRVQIQEALKRCQKACKYNTGGKGRQRKLQALDRYEKAEKNYVDTKLHQYSRELVNLAVSNGCGVICLVNQKPREDAAKLDHEKGEHLIFRNWSYFGLKAKIQYKCKLVGIKLSEDGKEEKESEDEE